MVRMIDGRPILTHCVVSVWHSGTRTLVRHLRDEHQEYGVTTHQHFLHYDAELKMYGGRGDLVHVPIRNPMDVAESWARRSKPIEKLLSQYQSMFDYLEREEPELHKVEDLGRLAGTQDVDVVRDKPVAAVATYQETVWWRVVAPNYDFFKQYYQLSEDGPT